MKKILAIGATLLMVLGVFAQSAKSTGLTDNDVKNFAKNYAAIEKGLDKIGALEDSSDIGSIKELAEAEALLEKNGISGPNRCKKVGMIGVCVALAVGEEEMGGMDAESLALLKQYGMEDPFAQLRAMSNEDDYKVVKRNFNALKKAMDF